MFDSLKFYDKLKAANVPEKQARAQAEIMRDAFAAYDAGKMKDLATKGDIASVRSDMRETEARLQKEMREMELRLLKWQIGGFAALAAIMAKGFGWLGFYDAG